MAFFALTTVSYRAYRLDWADASALSAACASAKNNMTIKAPPKPEHHIQEDSPSVSVLNTGTDVSVTMTSRSPMSPDTTRPSVQVAWTKPNTRWTRPHSLVAQGSVRTRPRSAIWRRRTRGSLAGSGENGRRAEISKASMATEARPRRIAPASRCDDSARIQAQYKSARGPADSRNRANRSSGDTINTARESHDVTTP